jgi:flavin reductase (DIM6/NTAB) family NADH-FMN oxidoreductase RutF
MLTMRSIDMSTLTQPQAYKLLIGSVVPRPIAWVSTANEQGVSNLAPFSFFNAVCSQPPTLMFCVSTQADLSEKDTLRNIRATGEFVVHVVNMAMVEAMNASAVPAPHGVSEIDLQNLATEPSVMVKPPRVKGSPIHFECRLTQIVEIGPAAPGSARMVIGQVVYAHVDEAICDEALHIDTHAWQPVARMAGNAYGPVGEQFTLPRPMWNPKPAP